MGINDLSEEQFQALYGRWAPGTPADIARLFDGYEGLWWVAGGWALEAFTGISRHHDDIDPEALREQLPLLQAHLAGRFHTWAASSGALKPLLPDDEPVLPDGCGQLWLRQDASSDWEFDLLLSTSTTTEWVYKRDPRIRMPIDDALWERDGIRYLQPELQLLLKAKGLRPKDQADFDATVPRLDARRRTWLADALAVAHPGHPWLAALA
ncbi:hypothetical protein GCM10028820_13500 [Tessaracoccus terricola]